MAPHPELVVWCPGCNTRKVTKARPRTPVACTSCGDLFRVPPGAMLLADEPTDEPAVEPAVEPAADDAAEPAPGAAVAPSTVVAKKVARGRARSAGAAAPDVSDEGSVEPAAPAIPRDPIVPPPAPPAAAGVDTKTSGRRGGSVGRARYKELHK